MHLINKSLVNCIKIKFSVQNLFSKCGQNHILLRIYSHLLKKLLKENFIICALYSFIFDHCNAIKTKQVSLSMWTNSQFSVALLTSTKEIIQWKTSLFVHYIYVFGYLTLAKQHRFSHTEKCFPVRRDLVIWNLRVNFSVAFRRFLMNTQELDVLIDPLKFKH